MMRTPDMEMGALETSKATLSASARRPYKIAWVAALLGFSLGILAFLLNLYIELHRLEFIRGYLNSNSHYETPGWLYGIAGIAGFIGTVLIVASIVFVIRGLVVDKDRRRSGTYLIGTLKKLQWVALIALALYLLYFPVSYLFWFISENSYGLVYVAHVTNVAFIFVYALPLIVAHALYKSSTGTS